MYVNGTPQRRQAFSECPFDTTDDGKLELITDGDTRWNSSYLMIERATLCCHRLNTFVARHTSNKLRHPLSEKSALTEDDWEILEELMGVLEPFWDCTKSLEGRGPKGHNGTLWEILPQFDYLIHHLEEATKKYSGSGIAVSQALHDAVERAYAKLVEYYTRTDDSPYHAAALVLHPYYKWRYREELGQQ